MKAIWYFGERFGYLSLPAVVYLYLEAIFHRVSRKRHQTLPPRKSLLCIFSCALCTDSIHIRNILFDDKPRDVACRQETIHPVFSAH